MWVDVLVMLQETGVLQRPWNGLVDTPKKTEFFDYYYYYYYYCARVTGWLDACSKNICCLLGAER
jgi:hypothetical protein